jgi:hypothetical protein
MFKLGLLFVLSFCASFSKGKADSIVMPCPPSRAAVDSDISVDIVRKDGRYFYVYTLESETSTDTLANFQLPGGMADFVVESWGGAFKACWRTPITPVNPTGNGLSCLPRLPPDKGEWEGRFTLSSAAEPGAWPYSVSSIHIYESDTTAVSPDLQDYLSTREGDEAYQEAVLEQCARTGRDTYASDLLTGAILAPTNVPGILGDPVRFTSKANLIGKVGKVVREEERNPESSYSIRVYDSASDLTNAPDLTSVNWSERIAEVPCNARGVFVESISNNQVVSRQAWQVDSIPDCGAAGKKVMTLDMP